MCFSLCLSDISKSGMTGKVFLMIDEIQEYLVETSSVFQLSPENFTSVDLP